MPHILVVTKDDQPAIIKFYDYTKGGTDIVDQVIAKRMVKPKSRRWVVPAFSWVLDTALVNASTIKCMNNREDPRKQKCGKSFDGAYAFAMQLALPCLMYRHENSNGLSTALQKTISSYLGLKVTRVGPLEPNKQLRCETCLQEIHGKGHKKKKDALSKTKVRCDTCENALCNKRMWQRCPACVANM